MPVKTDNKVPGTIKRYCKAQVEFDLLSNAAFLREGFAIEDIIKPNRVAEGVGCPRPVPAIKEVYTPSVMRTSAEIRRDLAAVERASCMRCAGEYSA